MNAIVEFVDAVKRHEPGTLVYEAFQEAGGTSFLHLMKFKNRRAQAIHETTPHVKRFVKILYPKCRRPPVFKVLKLVRGHHTKQ